MEVFIIIEMGKEGVLARRAFDDWYKANRFIVVSGSTNLDISRQYLSASADTLYAYHQYDEKRDACLYRYSGTQFSPEYDLCVQLAIE